MTPEQKDAVALLYLLEFCAAPSRRFSIHKSKAALCPFVVEIDNARESLRGEGETLHDAILLAVRRCKDAKLAR